MQRHKWKKTLLPWALADTMGAYKAEECEHCHCMKLHIRAGNIYYSKFLKDGKYQNKRPECN